jgi:imidazolonepropionase-like amidohydrolase
MKDDSYCILAGTLIDGSGSPFKTNVFVTVSEGIVTKISHEIEPGVSYYDLSDHTLMPTLVDSHIHLCLSGTMDAARRSLQLKASYEELLPSMGERLRKYSALGITGLRDGGDYGGYSMRFARGHAGMWEGSIEIKSAGRGWHAEGRYGKLLGRSPGPGLSLADAILESEEPCDHVKIVNSGVVYLKEFGTYGGPQFGREDLKAAVYASHRMGLKVMVHANGPKAVSDAVWAGCDTVEHGFFMGKECMEMMAEKGVFWIPTVCAMEALALAFPQGSVERKVALMCLEHQLDQVAVASEKGVPIALGTDSGSIGVNHGTSLGSEIRLFMKAGIAPQTIIALAARNGCRILGTGAGEVREGLRASILAIRGKPSDALGGFSSHERRVFLSRSRVQRS